MSDTTSHTPFALRGPRPGRTTDSNDRTSAEQAVDATVASDVPDDIMSPISLADMTLIINHRIGSLLSSVEGYTELLIPALNRSEDRETAFRIMESVSRMNGVLADLKHFNVDSSPERHAIPVPDLLNGLMHLLADSEAARLRFESTADRIEVDVDARLIRQGLLSVLRNAFEATQADQSPVTLHVDVPSSAGSSEVRFRIGSPLPLDKPEERARVFDPFYTTKAANLGLGLTMARRHFRLHGGDVVLSSSAVEMTTEFTCTIPVLR